MTMTDCIEPEIIKSPIIFDQKLWDALTPDREKFPFFITTRKDTETIPCPGCGKNTRGRTVSAEEMPGTVTRVTSDGLCSTCWKKSPELRPEAGRTRSTATDAVTRCPGCKARTRHKSKTLEDYPGTLRRVNNSGVCRTCYRKETGGRA